jgi:3-oxoadipate CoA-transferase alpha subunit
MAINKIVGSAEEALAGLTDGATVLVSGFGEAGSPSTLLEAAATMGLRGLTVVSNNAGFGDKGLAALLASGAVDKMVCSYPKTIGSHVFPELYRAGKIQLELVPQGTLSERIRAAGAGVAAFYTRTGSDTPLGDSKEHRQIDGEDHILEYALAGDFALIRGAVADRWGNATYSKSARNYGPTMAAAAKVTVIEVTKVVPLGSIDPEAVVTPGILVDRVLEVTQ